jgi:hypothetical protein
MRVKRSGAEVRIMPTGPGPLAGFLTSWPPFGCSIRRPARIAGRREASKTATRGEEVRGGSSDHAIRPGPTADFPHFMAAFRVFDPEAGADHRRRRIIKTATRVKSQGPMFGSCHPPGPTAGFPHFMAAFRSFDPEAGADRRAAGCEKHQDRHEVRAGRAGADARIMPPSPVPCVFPSWPLFPFLDSVKTRASPECGEAL